jgi:hypothetical protein
MRKIKHIIYITLICCLVFTGCGKEEKEEAVSEEQTVITNGYVESSSDFIPLGLMIDVKQENGVISNVTYEIIDNDIAAVSFVYNGLNCELRGSSIYKSYELAGIEDTSTGNIKVGGVNGYNATYYTLNPGRVVFWNDDNIHYSLYIYVTAEDSVVDSILNYITFEDHYNERLDVIADTEAESKVFAAQIVSVFQNKDMSALSEMLFYPQQLGNGTSAGNINEFLNSSEDDIFTDGILKAMDDNAADGIRTNDNGDYVIGSSYKNIYFRYMDDGTFKIIKINN